MCQTVHPWAVFVDMNFRATEKTDTSHQPFNVGHIGPRLVTEAFDIHSTAVEMDGAEDSSVQMVYEGAHLTV